jgi:hypothetical protein
MKIVYTERYTVLSPLIRSHYCACGNHSPRLVEQLEPSTEYKWRVECPECCRETPMFSSSSEAKRAWSENNLC